MDRACGTSSCRHRIHGTDWRRPDLQERYLDRKISARG